MSVFLWIIIPYLAIATFVLGHVWRYRYDKFGWTTRSSQLYESRLLRLTPETFMPIAYTDSVCGFAIP